MLNNDIVKLSDTNYCVMPWVGTKAIMALLFYFQSKGLDAEIFASSGVSIGIMISDSNEKTIREVYEQAKSEIINVLDLPVNEDAINLGGKFDDYIEPSLLKKEFLVDYLDVNDLQENIF